MNEKWLYIFRLDSVKDSEEKVNAQFENARKKAKKVRTSFEKIKTDRFVNLTCWYSTQACPTSLQTNNF